MQAIARSGFRTHCPPHWPRWARQWAGSEGSLTTKLMALGQGFAVQPNDQGLRNLCRAQRQWLGQTGLLRFRERSVVLSVGGQPVVAARTWMRWSGPRCDWPFWSGLGNRSLGSRLFADPQVRRGKVHYCKLPRRSAWVQTLLGPALYEAMCEQCRDTGWYVRGAQFTRAPNHTPLWVFEVFLPTLQKASAGHIE